MRKKPATITRKNACDGDENVADRTSCPVEKRPRSTLASLVTERYSTDVSGLDSTISKHINSNVYCALKIEITQLFDLFMNK